MIHSKIERKVNGHFMAPDSTRDLSGISPDEFNHIRLAVIASIREAEAFMAMNDQEVELYLQNAAKVRKEYGLQEFDPSGVGLNEARADFVQRKAHLESLLARMEPHEGSGNIGAITPDEYRMLVEALQFSLNEAAIFQSLAPEDLQQGGERLRAMYQNWELAPWSHYDPWLDQGPAWFGERHWCLTNILFAVNQPYEERRAADSQPAPHSNI